MGQTKNADIQDIFITIVTLMYVQLFVFPTNFALTGNFKLYAKRLALAELTIGWMVCTSIAWLLLLVPKVKNLSPKV